MSGKTPIRAGFWGTGSWAGRLADAMRTLPEFSIARCWGGRRAPTFAESYDCELAESESAFLSTPGMDAVIITTPNGVHREQALAALGHGLAVFLEKPVATTQQEAAEILEGARGITPPLFVGHNHRRESRARLMKRFLDDGVIGRPLLANVIYTSHAGLLDEVGKWRYDPSQCPATGLSQIGVHALDTLHFFFGYPIRVSAMIRPGVLGQEVEDLCVAELEFEGGTLATLTNGYSIKAVRTLNILGTKGMLESRSVGELLVHGLTHGVPPVSQDFSVNDTLVDELQEFAKVIVGQASPETGAAEGYAVVAVLEALIRSSAEGRSIEPDYGPMDQK